MQDAFGGILSIVLVVMFLVIVVGILGFTVNYTKAFKMKNIIISAIEEYEEAQCIKKANSPCRTKIRNGAKSIGYSPSSIRCPRGYTKVEEGMFCIKEFGTQNGYKKYRIITQVDMDIPIIRYMMSLSFFQVSGDTRIVQKQN